MLQNTILASNRRVIFLPLDFYRSKEQHLQSSSLSLLASLQCWQYIHQCTISLYLRHESLILFMCLQPTELNTCQCQKKLPLPSLNDVASSQDTRFSRKYTAGSFPLSSAQCICKLLETKCDCVSVASPNLLNLQLPLSCVRTGSVIMDMEQKV